MSIKKYIPIIFIGILIFLIGAGYYFVWPKFQQFREKRKEIEEKQEEIETREEYLLNLDNLLKELSKYTDEISKVNSALPSVPSVAALFNYFQKTSSQSGLIFKQIDVSQLFGSKQSKVTSKVRKMSFSITVSGSYSSFKDFILAIYKNTRLIEIKSIAFSNVNEKDSEREVTDLFDFDLDIETQSYNPSYISASE